MQELDPKRDRPVDPVSADAYLAAATHSGITPITSAAPRHGRLTGAADQEAAKQMLTGGPVLATRRRSLHRLEIRLGNQRRDLRVADDLALVHCASGVPLSA